MLIDTKRTKILLTFAKEERPERLMVGGYVQVAISDKGRYIHGKIIEKTSEDFYKITPGHGIEFIAHKEQLGRSDAELLLNQIKKYQRFDLEKMLTKKTPKLEPKKSNYTKHGVKTFSGNKCIDIDDKVAEYYRGDDIDLVWLKFAFVMRELGFKWIGVNKKTKVDPEELRIRYGHLNYGMQKMHIANMTRAAMKRAGVKRIPEYND